MKAKEVVNFVKNHPEINVVAFGYTPWHLLGAKAYIYGLSINTTALFVMFKHPDTGFALSETDVLDDNFKYVIKADDDFYFNDGYKERLKYFVRDLFSKNSQIYLVKPATPAFRFGAILYNTCGKPITFVVTDEGAAVYMKTNVPKNNFFSIPLNFLKKLMNVTHNVDFNFLLQKNKDNKLVVNDKIAKNYLQVLHSNYQQTESIIFEKKSVIICTTAWKRDEIVNDNDYCVVKNVINIFLQNGFAIYLKPHPRDVFFKKIILKDHKDVVLCDEHQPIEVIFIQKNLPTYIVSFSSTALINAKIFSNITPICLTNLLDRKSISDYYLKEIDCFVKTFGDLIYYPNSIEDIENLLEKQYQ